MHTNESKYLSLNRIAKRYGKTVAIAGIDLEVNWHELLAVVGPSGCGKTTLLRLISGLTRSDAGSITLQERTLFRAEPELIVPPHQRKIGMVFQNYALWSHMTILKNVAYPLRIKGMRWSEQVRAVEDVLSLVHLTGCESRYPHQLSGGEQQRVALARALTMKPEVLLLDEPLSNLDAHLRDEMGKEIKRIQKETGITILYVTHDQSEAMALADRIAVMENGKIMQIGQPNEVYKRPQSSFVAGFIGISNLLQCQIENGGGKITARLQNEVLVEIKELQGDATGLVKLSVRPEDIILDKNGNGVAGIIQTVRYHGNFVRYGLASAGNGFTVEAAANSDFQVGDHANFYFRRAVVIPVD